MKTNQTEENDLVILGKHFGNRNKLIEIFKWKKSIHRVVLAKMSLNVAKKNQSHFAFRPIEVPMKEQKLWFFTIEKRSSHETLMDENEALPLEVIRNSEERSLLVNFSTFAQSGCITQ